MWPKRSAITETKAYSVASFYENFSFEQKGKYVLKICDGTACHVRKSTPVLQYLRQELGLSETKQTTDDLMSRWKWCPAWAPAVWPRP